MSVKLEMAFEPADYKSSFDRTYINPYDGRERTDAMQRFKTALATARPRYDYKLLDHFDRIEVFFKSNVDAERFEMSMNQNPIELMVFQGTPGYALHKLKKHCSSLRRAASEAGFDGVVNFEVDRNERSILVISEHKAECFRFIDLATDNGLMDRYTKLMVKIHGESAPKQP